MGTLVVPLEIANLNGTEFVSVEALVDTGSTHTVLGEDLLTNLGVRPTDRSQYQLGDDRVVEYRRGFAQLRLAEKEGIAPVVFGPPGVSPLIGAVTLQVFELAVDPLHERLIPAPPRRARPFRLMPG